MQSVKVNQSFSDAFFVRSGVPQGNRTGPILFLVFINDIVKVVNYSELFVFADDMAKNKKIKINTGKTDFLRVFRSSNTIDFEYRLENSSLYSRVNTRDLGVIYDKKFTFIDHADFIYKKR